MNGKRSWNPKSEFRLVLAADFADYTDFEQGMTSRRVLLPLGEGGAKRRMRADGPQRFSIHTLTRPSGTLSQRAQRERALASGYVTVITKCSTKAQESVADYFAPLVSRSFSRQMNSINSPFGWRLAVTLTVHGLV